MGAGRGFAAVVSRFRSLHQSSCGRLSHLCYQDMLVNLYVVVGLFFPVSGWAKQL